ncbi:hypothetical protein XO10_04620 [Marinitoga sp. 1135]|uniref:M24 family metallopeptidase n=1 Tax=Marinitoga sp. 1135 TaxID=1643333 RepID=UPI001586CBAE|nr:M24 family metallopeptidase [Marinitoga sp. 1135]NUU95567.1 hypothetical protein [Marinitoga sp. 1135]
MNKIKKLRNLIYKYKLNGLWLKKNSNFSWLFHGKGWISISHELSCASILITKDNIYVITNNIESKRLKKEENVNFKIIEYNWFESEYNIIKNIVKDINKIGTDFGFGFGINVEIEIKKIRMVLEEEDIKLYKKSGNIVMRIFEETISQISPKMTELEVAGNIYRNLQKEGFYSYVILVFSDDSRTKYRHNLPRNVQIGNRGFISICVTNGGPIISMTRSFLFIEDEDFINQHRINAELEAKIINLTKKNIYLKDMFYDIKEIYKNIGFEKEFDKHHQGGIIGYDTREEIAQPNSKIKIENNMAFCWNPTITGTKSEDTFILNQNDIDFITWNKNSIWPVLSFDINGDIITRPGVLKIR